MAGSAQPAAAVPQTFKPGSLEPASLAPATLEVRGLTKEYRRGTPVAPEEAARRALSEVWGEVLGWSNETLGHRRIVTEALEPE